LWLQVRLACPGGFLDTVLARTGLSGFAHGATPGQASFHNGATFTIAHLSGDDATDPMPYSHADADNSKTLYVAPRVSTFDGYHVNSSSFVGGRFEQVDASISADAGAPAFADVGPSLRVSLATGQAVSRYRSDGDSHTGFDLDLLSVIAAVAGLHFEQVG